MALSEKKRAVLTAVMTTLVSVGQSYEHDARDRHSILRSITGALSSSLIGSLEILVRGYFGILYKTRGLEGELASCVVMVRSSRGIINISTPLISIIAMALVSQ